jgi:hypothetical protein
VTTSDLTLKGACSSFHGPQSPIHRNRIPFMFYFSGFDSRGQKPLASQSTGRTSQNAGCSRRLLLSPEDGGDLNRPGKSSPHKPKPRLLEMEQISTWPALPVAGQPQSSRLWRQLPPECQCPGCDHSNLPLSCKEGHRPTITRIHSCVRQY